MLLKFHLFAHVRTFINYYHYSFPFAHALVSIVSNIRVQQSIKDVDLL